MAPEKDVIASGNHPTIALTKMRSLREKSLLCDIALKIGDREILAHKVVLAASSPYFEFMFTGNVTERTKECIEIDGFCPVAFLTVVNFMYSGYLTMNEETMLDVLKVADFLKISGAKEKCLTYVQEHIEISNCIRIRDIAKKHYFTELEAKVNRFIEKNFVVFINTEAFFRLSVDEVKGLITDHTSCTDISSYEKAISNWVNHEKSSREELKEDLLGIVNVHIQNLAQRELDDYYSFPKQRIYVMNRAASSDGVYFLDLKTSVWNCVRDRPKFDCLPPIFHKQSVYVVGNDKCGRLDIENEEWELKTMPFSNDYIAGCSVETGIYLISDKPSKKTFMYITETDVLCTERELISARSHPGVAFSENCLYVCGGGTYSAERRDMRTNIWRPISHVPTLNDACSATSFRDRIYLASVSSGKFFEFDKRKGVWIPKANIPKTDQSSFTLGSTDESIYSFAEKKIYKYEISSNKWDLVRSLTCGYSSFLCVNLQQK